MLVFQICLNIFKDYIFCACDEVCAATEINGGGMKR